MLQKLNPRSRWFAQYGPYYVVDANMNAIVASSCDLDKLYREVCA